METDDDLQADWSASELSVLRTAELDVPPPGSVERTLTAIGVGATLGAGAGLGGASSLASVANVGRMAHASFWLKWLGAAAIGGGIASVVFLAKHQAAPVAPAPIASATAVSHVPELPPKAPAPPPERPALAEPAPVPARSVAPARTDSAERADKAADNKDALADEIRIIDEARGRVRQGDATGALEALRRYDQLVKRGGSMRAEATVVRIEALKASGDAAGAGALADRFLSKNPDSPYADYVKRILGQAH